MLKLEKRVHLSAGVQIGGVLEPAQATPTIIEDDAFIGAGCIVVEGVCVSEGACLPRGWCSAHQQKFLKLMEMEKLFKSIMEWFHKNAIVIRGTSKRRSAFSNANFGGVSHRRNRKKVEINDLLRQF